MLFIVLLALLIFTNTRLARRKGRNPLVWGLITLLAFFMSYCVLGSVYLAIIYKGPLTRDALTAYLMAEPLVIAMLTLLGIGGVLIVRFILERSKANNISGQ